MARAAPGGGVVNHYELVSSASESLSKLLLQYIQMNFDVVRTANKTLVFRKRGITNEDFEENATTAKRER